MTPAGRGLPRSARLLRPADFARVYAGRCSAAAGPLVLYAAPAAEGTSARLGLSVSRRIGTAVIRNRWKRVLRETFRGIRGGLPAGHDFVLVVRSGSAPPSGAEGLRRIGESILALAARVVGRPGYGRPRPPAADADASRRRR